MFTWISKRSRKFAARAVMLGAAFSLSACLGDDVGTLSFLSSGKDDKVARDVMRKAELYEGDVIVQGPSGYCIDRRTLRRSKNQGFVLLASCESLSGIRGDGVEPVLMTVSVLPNQPGVSKPSVAEIAASMSPAQVLGTYETEQVTLVHFDSGGEDVLAEGDGKHWRGGMVLNGHLIGLALYARDGSAKAGKEGQALMLDLARKMRRASPKRPVKPLDTTSPSTNTPSTLLEGLFPNPG